MQNMCYKLGNIHRRRGKVNGKEGDTLVIYSHNSNGSPGDFAEEYALE